MAEPCYNLSPPETVPKPAVGTAIRITKVWGYSSHPWVGETATVRQAEESFSRGLPLVTFVEPEPTRWQYASPASEDVWCAYVDYVTLSPEEEAAWRLGG